jgi:hypothetical protein
MDLSQLKLGQLRLSQFRLGKLKLGQLKLSQLSQPKLLAGGAAAALVIGLGFGLLARAPIDRAMAHTATRPTPAITPSLTVERISAGSQGSGPITAGVYPSADAFPAPPRPPQATPQDSTLASSDEQPVAYDETQPPRDGAEARDQERALDYPPPPPPSGSRGDDGPEA